MQNLQEALVKAGLSRPLKLRNRNKERSIGKCKVCGGPLIVHQNTNIATCINDSCKNNHNFMILTKEYKPRKNKN